MDDFKIEFDSSAEQDLDSYVNYYEDLTAGLGLRFRMAVEGHISTLKTIPRMQVRYDEIRCVPVIGFPFMLHYSLIPDKRMVRIHALIHTSRNPSGNWNKDDWRVSEEMPLYGAHNYDLEYDYAA